MLNNKPSQGESRRKNVLKTALIIVITFIIFYVIFSKIDFFSVIDVLYHANLWYLAIAFMGTVLIPLIQAKRWKIILKAMGYNIRYLECFCMVMGTHPLASVTPSKAGDLAKAYYISDKIPISKTVGSVLTEKALDVFTLLLLCLIGLAFYPRLWVLIIAVIIIIGIIVFFRLSHSNVNLPIKKSWNDKLHNMLLSTRALIKDKKMLSTDLLLEQHYKTVGSRPQRKNEEFIIEMLKHRESLGSTALGNGVAFPHGRSIAIKDLTVLFARSTGGVDFDSLDGKPTKVFFLIIAPSDRGAETYLSLLSELISLMQKPSKLKALYEVTDFEALKEVLGE